MEILINEEMGGVVTAKNVKEVKDFLDFYGYEATIEKFKGRSVLRETLVEETFKHVKEEVRHVDTAD